MGRRLQWAAFAACAVLGWLALSDRPQVRRTRKAREPEVPRALPAAQAEEEPQETAGRVTPASPTAAHNDLVDLKPAADAQLLDPAAKRIEDSPHSWLYVPAKLKCRVFGPSKITKILVEEVFVGKPDHKSLSTAKEIAGAAWLRRHGVDSRKLGETTAGEIFTTSIRRIRGVAVRVSAKGHRLVVSRVPVRRGVHEYELELSLKPERQIAGRVTDEDGAPLPNQTVRVYITNDMAAGKVTVAMLRAMHPRGGLAIAIENGRTRWAKTYFARTDADGKYSIAAAATGDIQVVLVEEGLQPSRTAVGKPAEHEIRADIVSAHKFPSQFTVLHKQKPLGGTQVTISDVSPDVRSYQPAVQCRIDEGQGATTFLEEGRTYGFFGSDSNGRRVYAYVLWSGQSMIDLALYPHKLP